MLSNYVPSQRIINTDYELEFLYPGRDGGFSFPCRKDGSLYPMTEAAKINYEWCVSNEDKFEVYNKITSRKYASTDPAHGRCECGREVYLTNQYYGACQCECGRWYNLFGQELNPPDMWEEPFDDD